MGIIAIKSRNKKSLKDYKLSSNKDIRKRVVAKFEVVSKSELEKRRCSLYEYAI